MARKSNTGGGTPPPTGGSGVPVDLGAFIDFGTEVYGNAARKREAQRAREYDKYQTELAYKRDIAGRDYDNFYNSPGEQYKRYQDSGLNPALMHAGQPQAAATTKKAEKAEAKFHVPQNMNLDVLGKFMQQAQIKNINANTESTNLLNTEKKQELGIEAGDPNNVRYTKAFNDAVKSAEDALNSFQQRLLTEKNVKAQELRNKVLELERDLANEGVLRGQNPINTVINAVINALAKSNISLSDITAKYIMKWLN